MRRSVYEERDELGYSKLVSKFHKPLSLKDFLKNQIYSNEWGVSYRLRNQKVFYSAKGFRFNRAHKSA